MVFILALGRERIWWLHLFFFLNRTILISSVLFSSEKFLVFEMIALSFLFDKYCPIM